jgi:hypothetical protein
MPDRAQFLESGRAAGGRYLAVQADGEAGPVALLAEQHRLAGSLERQCGVRRQQDRRQARIAR